MAANSPGGTSYPRLRQLPRPRSPARPAPRRRASAARDQSWYVALAPYPNPRYVVVATVEAGGFGADTAAPADLQDPHRAAERQEEGRLCRQAAGPGGGAASAGGQRGVGCADRSMSTAPLGTSVKGFDEKPRNEPRPGSCASTPLLLLGRDRR